MDTSKSAAAGEPHWYAHRTPLAIGPEAQRLHLDSRRLTIGVLGVVILLVVTILAVAVLYLGLLPEWNMLPDMIGSFTNR